MATHIFYHSADLDGKCGGAICARATETPWYNVRGIDHGDFFPLDKIGGSDTVILVDYTPPPDIFLLLCYRLSSLQQIVWLDHHDRPMERAVEAAKRVGYIPGDIPGNWKKKDGLSGCGKAWTYFHDEPMPYPVRLLDRYDVWDHENPDVLDFQYGMRGVTETNPDASVWTHLLEIDSVEDSYFLEIFSEGRAIHKYVQTHNANLAAACVVMGVQWREHIWLAINAPLSNSKVVDGLWCAEDVGVLVFAFHGSKNKWKVSLYANPEGSDVDMSEIAQSMGGGGHKGAAGFWCDELPFDLIKKEA